MPSNPAHPFTATPVPDNEATVSAALPPALQHARAHYKTMLLLSSHDSFHCGDPEPTWTEIYNAGPGSVLALTRDSTPEDVAKAEEEHRAWWAALQEVASPGSARAAVRCGADVHADFRAFREEATKRNGSREYKTVIHIRDTSEMDGPTRKEGDEGDVSH